MRKDPLKKIPAAIFFAFLFVAPGAFGEENIPALIKKVEPSIVVILNYDQNGKIRGQGTGFFINKDGDVITNHHVLEEASRSGIKLHDGREYPVKKILAEDPEGDLIRLSVDIPENAGIPPPLTASPALPSVGEKIIVIGTPLGLDRTVSDGIVSAVREIPGFGKIVQMTAPISPGSSGSPVLNMRGEVVGVATFLIDMGQNLNFAIPAERITRMTAVKSRTLAERAEKDREERLVKAAELYVSGLRYLWAGKYDFALPYFVEAVKVNPEHALAYFQMGLCLNKLGKIRESLEPYRKAAQLQPQDATIFTNLCGAYGDSGRYGEALQACRRAIELKPDVAEAHNNLAWVYQRLGRSQEAIQASRDAIRLHPDLAAAHYNLGNSYAALKRYQDAADSYKQAIRIEFDYAQAHLNLGSAYLELGRIEDAMDSYKRALLLKPLMPEGHLNLGMAYLKLGNRGSAIEEYKILKDLNKEMANSLFDLIYE